MGAVQGAVVLLNALGHLLLIVLYLGELAASLNNKVTTWLTHGTCILLALTHKTEIRQPTTIRRHIDGPNQGRISISVLSRDMRVLSLLRICLFLTLSAA